MEIGTDTLAYIATTVTALASGYAYIKRQGEKQAREREERATRHAEEMEGIRTRLTRLEVQIKSAFAFQIRRGALEGENKGYLEQNSPLRVLAALRRPLEPLRGELEAWWRNGGSAMDEEAQFAEIERRWGNQLVKRVCKPLGVHEGACWLAAYSVASGQETLRLRLLGETNGTLATKKDLRLEI